MLKINNKYVKESLMCRDEDKYILILLTTPYLFSFAWKPKIQWTKTLNKRFCIEEMKRENPNHYCQAYTTNLPT